MNTETPRQTAALDQFGAFLREQRHMLCKLHANAGKKYWFKYPKNVHDLALYMIDQCDDMDEVRRVIGEVLSEPWKWRTEFVCGKCRELDGCKGK